MGWFSWKSLWEFDEVLNRETVSEHLPYRAYDEERGLFYMAHVNNDAIGACWMASPLLGLSDDMLRKFESMFRLVFPEGSTMQFSFLASENIEPLLDRLVAMRRACSPDSPYVVLAEEIRRFYLESQKSSLIPSSKLRPRDFQLFVSIGVPISRSLDTKKALDEEADKVLELVQSIESSLQTGNLSLRRLDDLDLVTLMYFLCNPSHGYETRPHRVQEEEPLNEQMVRFDTVLEQDRDGFTLDGQHVRSLTVQEFPDPEDSTWHGSKNRELIGSLRSIMDQITCRFMITLNVVFLDSMTERTRLSQKHILLTNQYSPTLAKMIPPLAKKKLNFDLAVKQLEDGATSIGAYYHILVFGATAEAAQNYAQTVIQHYAKFNWTVSPDPVISLKLFLHSLPMALPPDVGYLRNSLMRLKTLNSSVLPHLLPVVGDWPGFGDPVCILTSRSGQIVPFDPFSNESGNYSMCVAGRSGSGKSFFMNYFITGYLGIGGRFWVIDKGGSYTKLCGQVGGQYISFNDVKDKLGLNPFGLMVSGEIEEKAMVLNVLCKMASPTEKMGDMETRAMEQAFDRVWEGDGKDGTPSMVARVLKEADDSRIRDLAIRLHPFSEGKYSSIFQRTNLVEFTNPFVLLEVSGLDAVPDFRSVLLMQLVMSINREMWVNDEILSCPKIVAIDEAHELLNEHSGFMGDFIVKSARTIRKRKGGVVIITQGLEDYYNKFPPHGEELLANSDFLVLLSHKPESVAALKRQERLILNEGQMLLLESLHRFKKEYSEAYIRVPGAGGNGTVGGVCRLVMDPLSRWMFTTDPNELTQIDRYVKQGMTVVEACNRCVKDEESRMKPREHKHKSKHGVSSEETDSTEAA